jgi:protein subunit release factor A
MTPPTPDGTGDADFEVTTGCDAAHLDRRGGQHVAKTCTAVRILHKPTGIAVTSTNERSQYANRIKAMECLIAILRTQP